ncbi:glycosyltransferase family 1 protein [Flavobacterium ranwuense]|uniref:Glycosyltransferase family 1 protein n=1 Tax=Flavobacterium ranwuense TaxID=2541725 RepID=A0ABY2DRR3_9FLAO|nr:glycosyltransferase family 1 protein [Flavobacterium ranwuense]TDE28046.1 glycosyltransferase family 1 protein [Flavobacterium ranwuense]
MRILVVVDSINIEDSSGSKANVALIRNLKKAGFELLVYHYSRKKINLDGIACVSIKEIKFSFLYFLSRTQREISKITKINSNPKIESLFGFSFTFFNDVKSIKKGLMNIQNFQPDWVLTLSIASSFRPHKALLGLPQWHSKWLAYVHDPYPMHSYPRPYDWVEPGHQFKRDFFWQITEKSKYVLYPSKILSEWMGGYYYNQYGKEIIIPHQIFNENKDIDSILVPTFFNPNDFNILHAGSMMDARNPITLVVAFELFLAQNPDAKSHAKLLFIGNKSSFDTFIRDKQKTLSQVFRSDDYLPFQEVMAMQEAAAVNVILEAIGPISPFLPGKFPHCIQTQKPILLLGPYYSESKRLLGEEYPYWSEVNDIEKIQSHINKLYQSWLENKNLIMNRPDLMYYLSPKYLRKTLIELKP